MVKRIITILALVSLVVGASVMEAKASDVKLLFAYSPGCPHCSYQKPIIREFEKKHPEVDVTWVRYYNLNYRQKELIEGTSGHPVMVFYSGGNVRQVVGETSIYTLEEEYGTFKRQLRKTVSSRTTTGSYSVCY